MTKQNNLFLATLGALYKSGAFEYIILIGSWCYYFYRAYFNNAPEIPVVRTMDIDFLIPNPVKIRKDINIPVENSFFICNCSQYNPHHLQISLLACTSVMM